MILLLLAAQAATPAASPVAPPAAPTSFSILEPIADEPCARRGIKTADPEDIVVCGGKPLPSQKLPYPNEIVPDSPQPSNPYLRGTGSLALEATPCPARSGGCGTGIDIFGAGTTLVRLVQKAVAPSSCCEREGEATNVVMLAGDVVGGVKRAMKRRPDKSGRVPIPLDDAPLSTEGRLLP